MKPFYIKKPKQCDKDEISLKFLCITMMSTSFHLRINGENEKKTRRNFDSFAIKLSCKFISSGNLQRKDLLNYGIDRPSQIYLHSSFAKYVKYLRYQQILVLRAPASVNRRPRINTIFMIQTCVGVRRPPSSTFCCRFSKVAIACKITRF